MRNSSGSLCCFPFSSLSLVSACLLIKQFLPTRLQLLLLYSFDGISNIPSQRKQNSKMLILLSSSSYFSASSSLPVGNKLQINAAHARKMNPVCSSMHVQTCTQLRVHACVCTYSKLRRRRQSKTKAKLLWASSCCCFCFVIRNCFGLCRWKLFWNWIHSYSPKFRSWN